MSSSRVVERPLDAVASDAITDLALDLRWSFNLLADQLWEQLDPELWELTQNPWVMLQTVSREKLQSVVSNPKFQRLLADLRREKMITEEPYWNGRVPKWRTRASHSQSRSPSLRRRC